MIYFSKFGTVITEDGIALQFTEANQRLNHRLGTRVTFARGYPLHPAYNGNWYLFIGKWYPVSSPRGK